MAKGGSSTPQTQTTSVQLSPEQRQLLNLAMPYAMEFAANPPSAPTRSTVPGFDAAQTAGQNLLLNGAVPAQQQIAQQGTGASAFLTNPNILMPGSNPALQATIDASVRPIYDQLTARALPAIRSEARAAGQFGGSRQGVGEGLAIRDASRAAGDTAAKVATAGYQSGLDSMIKGLGLLPQTSQLQLAPGLTTSAVGDVRQNLLREQMAEAASREMLPQLMPLLTARELTSLLGAIPGGSTTTTASTAKQSPFGSALGGALSGASLGAGFGPIGAAGGAVLGGLLPFLG